MILVTLLVETQEEADRLTEGQRFSCVSEDFDIPQGNSFSAIGRSDLLFLPIKGSQAGSRLLYRYADMKRKAGEWK